MKRNMFILLFLTVVPCMQSLTRKYELIMERKTWPKAQAYCRDTYTDLAAMEGWDDLANLNTEAQTQELHSCAWIGVYTNTSDWHWSLGNESLGSITYWYSVVPYQEPNNANGIEDCCAFNLQGWFDRTCTELFAFMCFDGDLKLYLVSYFDKFNLILDENPLSTYLLFYSFVSKRSTNPQAGIAPLQLQWRVRYQRCVIASSAFGVCGSVISSWNSTLFTASGWCVGYLGCVIASSTIGVCGSLAS
ncbi:C-type mannose receptor 2-like isoform X1, partial [Clarias magur]